MRYSCDSDDPGFAAWSRDPRRHYVEVSIDGEVVRAITADTDEGYVLAYEERDGQMFIRDGEAATVERFGDVRIGYRSD